MPKFIFVTGGVVSSLGKGLTSGSIGMLLKKHRYNVSILKIDPYLNVDAGTMNPFQHGEVFVTDDGAETDLDLGNYERFLDENLSSKNSLTTGKIYQSVIAKERKGEYLGGTVQVIPHITNEIQERILSVAEGKDILIVELGGTVGDIEGLPFLEAIRQMPNRVGRENVLYCHLALIPYLEAAHEMKTKPAQHSVQELRRIGIQPDILICRTHYPLKEGMISKLALFCNVKEEAVIELIDCNSIYRIPINAHEKGLDRLIIKYLGLEYFQNIDLTDWKKIKRRSEDRETSINIALVGKYTNHKDSYLSINEAIKHAGISEYTAIDITGIESENLEKPDGLNLLRGYDGIVIPGGFGSRGIEGIIAAAKYGRENKIPTFGICLGMQMMCVEFARNVLGLSNANSTEIDSSTPDPILYLMQEQDLNNLGGTMRLGLYPCDLFPDTIARKAYDTDIVEERHRHRYEFNIKYLDKFENNGFIASGMCTSRNLVEIVELKDHPFYLGTQFHGEYKSRPNRPHPIFNAFIKACVNRANSNYCR